jgi:hypothetical protein
MSTPTNEIEEGNTHYYSAHILSKCKRLNDFPNLANICLRSPQDLFHTRDMKRGLTWRTNEEIPREMHKEAGFLYPTKPIRYQLPRCVANSNRTVQESIVHAACFCSLHENLL